MADEPPKKLEQITALLSSIEAHTRKPWYSLVFDGALHAVGFLVGTAFIISLTGVGLKLLGLYPNNSAFAGFIAEVLSNIPRNSGTSR